MAKNRNELVLQVLKVLGVLPVGQDVNAEEYEAVDALVDPIRGVAGARYYPCPRRGRHRRCLLSFARKRSRWSLRSRVRRTER
jgi:hypothetical protein